HLLSTVVVQRMHDAGTRNLIPGGRILERELEGVLLEELVEHLPAERAHGIDLVGSRVVLEEDRGEGLRRGAGHHLGARRRIVLAVLRAAMDHRGMAVARARLAAKADEADV